MLKLFVNNLKMLIRNKQSLFWSLMFPLIFTFIFGTFFGKGSSMTGNVILINKSKSPLAKSIEQTLDKTDLFKLSKSTNLSASRNLIKKNKAMAVILIPEGFGDTQPNAPTKIKLISDPSNAQGTSLVAGLLDKVLTFSSFQAQGAKPLFSIEQETTSATKSNYFDFVLVGLLGMALMNSSIQGIAIVMAKYKEDQILKRLTTTPLKTWKFIVAEVLSRLLLNFVQVSLILSIGVYVFGAHIYGNIPLVYLFALIGAILFQLIGFTIASLTKTTQAAEGMATAIAIPMMFLAGVFFPIDQLPKWLFSAVQYLPLAPLLRMIRGIALEKISPLENPMNIIIVIAWIIIALIISTYKFRLSEE
ncbi:MAG: ABC transporter permease [bacterium]|nr:ABC transporter permease [bacterium]